MNTSIPHPVTCPPVDLTPHPVSCPQQECTEEVHHARLRAESELDAFIEKICSANARPQVVAEAILVPHVEGTILSEQQGLSKQVQESSTPNMLFNMPLDLPLTLKLWEDRMGMSEDGPRLHPVRRSERPRKKRVHPVRRSERPRKKRVRLIEQ